VTPGTAFLTLRSDGNDKFAQADGRLVGKPGVPTGVTSEGPALKGATNLVLGALDHREVGFHPRAFREIYKFIAGREPSRIEIVAEAEVRLSGLVTGTPGGVVTDRPVSDATVEIYCVAPDTGERIGGADPCVADRRRRRWGPAQVDSVTTLRLPAEEAGRAVVAMFNTERIVARAWPASENRIAVAELTY
jgi:hypothetical protein